MTMVGRSRNSRKSHLCSQYSGFQQTAEKCAICGHLIMEMVKRRQSLSFVKSLSIVIHCNIDPFAPRRYCRLWASRITRAASGAAYATNASTACPSRSTSTIRSIVWMITTECSRLSARLVERESRRLRYARWKLTRLRHRRCAIVLQWRDLLTNSFLVLQGTEETVRVVSMDKDFHVDCYVCEDCGMQLTDEPDKRCYPLDGRLMCRACHIQRISHTQPRAPQPVSASYQFMG